MLRFITPATGTADVNSTKLLAQLNRRHTARPVCATTTTAGGLG